MLSLKTRILIAVLCTFIGTMGLLGAIHTSASSLTTTSSSDSLNTFLSNVESNFSLLNAEKLESASSTPFVVGTTTAITALTTFEVVSTSTDTTTLLSLLNDTSVQVASITDEGLGTFAGGLTSINLLASSDDSGAIGASGTAFSDLFLASGAVINFNAGDVTATHSANALTITGGTTVLDTGSTIGNLTLANGSITDSSGAISFGNENLSTTGTLASGVLTVTGALLSNTDDGGALGASGTGWSDLFLASGAVINFNAGDVTLTHSADTLTLAGGGFACSNCIDASDIANDTITYSQLQDATVQLESATANLIATSSNQLATSTNVWLSRQFPKAATITSIDCYALDAGTSTIQAEIRTSAITAGSDILYGTGLNCGSDEEIASSTLQNTAIAADDWITIDVPDAEPTGSRPRAVFFSITWTWDD